MAAAGLPKSWVGCRVSLQPSSTRRGKLWGAVCGGHALLQDQNPECAMTKE